MGELMVVVRAQDFASRTLRRVGNEVSGLSRLQAQQMRNAQRLKSLGMDESRLRTVAKQIKLDKQALAAANRLQTAQTALQQGAARWPAGFSTTQLSNRLGIPQLEKDLLNANAALDNHQKHFDRLPRSYKRLANDVARLGDKFRGVRVETAGLTAEQARLAKAIPIEHLDNMGRALSGIGRTLQLFGAIGVLAFGMASNSAANFDTQVMLAATQMRDLTGSADQIDVMASKLKNGTKHMGGILDLMGEFPATSQEMADSAYQIFSSMQLQNKGITDVNKGLYLLKIANKAAVAGQVTLEEATSAMIVSLNNFDPELKNVVGTMNTVFSIVRFGKMTLADFGKMMIPLATAAHQVGLSLEDIGGAMAFLTERQISPERVASGLARFLEILRDPSIVKGFKKMGIEINHMKTGKMKPLLTLIREIAEARPDLKTGQTDMMNFLRQVGQSGMGGGVGKQFTIQGRRVAGPLFQQLFEFAERQKQVINNADEFEIAYRKMAATPGVRFDVFLNQMKRIVLIIGEEAIPVFIMLGNKISKLTEWFQNLDPHTRRLIIQIGAIVAIGSLLAGVLAAVAGSIMTLTAFARAFALGGGAAAAGTLTTILLLAKRVAAIGAIVLLVKAIRGGDMGLWDFLMAAALGASMGARFGPWGALAGGIVVPVTMVMMNEHGNKNPIKAAFDQYQKQLGGNPSFWDAFKEDQSKGSFKNMWDWFNNAGETKGVGLTEFTRQWKLMQSLVTKGNREMTLSTINHRVAIGEIDSDVAKLFIKYNKGFKTTLSWMDRMEKQLKNIDNATVRGALAKELAEGKKMAEEAMKAYEELLKGTNNQIDAEEELARVRKDSYKQAIDSLRNMYETMLSENENAMGQLFKGPFLTGESFNLAKEWGITPSINDMLLDMTQQNQKFMQWRNNLDKLFAKGIPTELIDALRQMGPEEGNPLVENLLKAKPAQIQAIIQQWKIRNNQIQEATKMDFTRQINAFRKAGISMGEALINGFQSAKVGVWFEAWVKEKFPGIINAAVNEAVKEWKSTQAPGATPGGKNGQVPTPPGPKNTSSTTTITNQPTYAVHVTDASGNAYEKGRLAAFAMNNKNKMV